MSRKAVVNTFIMSLTVSIHLKYFKMLNPMKIDRMPATFLYSLCFKNNL